MSNKTRFELLSQYNVRPDGLIVLISQNSGTSHHKGRSLLEHNAALGGAAVIDFPTHVRSLKNHFGPAVVYERPDYEHPHTPVNAHNESQQENPRAVALSTGYNSAASAGQTAPWPTAHVSSFTPLNN